MSTKENNSSNPSSPPTAPTWAKSGFPDSFLPYVQTSCLSCSTNVGIEFPSINFSVFFQTVRSMNCSLIKFQLERIVSNYQCLGGKNHVNMKGPMSCLHQAKDQPMGGHQKIPPNFVPTCQQPSPIWPPFVWWTCHGASVGHGQNQEDKSWHSFFCGRVSRRRSEPEHIDQINC